MEHLTPNDVKLFGFEFMYVWNEFKQKNPSIVLEIEKSTLDEFGNLAIYRQHIINKCRRIMMDADFDVKKFNTQVISAHKQELETTKKMKSLKLETYDKKYVTDLEKKYNDLLQENKKLKEKIQILETENKRLKSDKTFSHSPKK